MNPILPLTLYLSPPSHNSAPRLSNPETHSWSCGYASLFTILSLVNLSAAQQLLLKTRTMGRAERGWIVCLSFLGFLVSVESITRGEFFPFGLSAGDQILTAGNDQTHQLELDNPVLFYDGTFDSIFVSYIRVWVHNVHRSCAIVQGGLM